jgi:hypothetical protein
MTIKTKADAVVIAAIEAGVPSLVEARTLIDQFHDMIRKLVDLGVKQVADNALGFVLALDGSRHDLVEGGLHAVELEFAHEVEQFGALH